MIRRNVCTALAPRLWAACSCSMPISSSTGTTSRMTSGSATNVVASRMPRRSEDHLEARVLERWAEPPVAPAVHEDQRQPDHDRGDGEGDVDQGAQEPPAGELVADEQQRHADAEDRVDHHRHDGHADREAQARGRRRGPRGSRARSSEAVGEGVLDDQPQRPRDQEEEVGGDDEAEQVGGRTPATGRQPRAGRGRTPRGASPQPRRTSRSTAGGRWSTITMKRDQQEHAGRPRRPPPTLSFSMLLRMRTEVTSVSKGRLPESSTSDPYSLTPRQREGSTGGDGGYQARAARSAGTW